MSGGTRLQPWRPEALREGLVVMLAAIVACGAGAVALTGPWRSGYESTAIVTGSTSLDRARSEMLARRALDAAGASREPASALLANSDVERESGGGLAFTVRADAPAAARRLANSYARTYVASVRPQERAQARPAARAQRTAGVTEALMAGAGIGVVLGLILVLLREAFDVRLTSSRGLSSRVAAKELGQVPAAPQALDAAYRVPAVEDAKGAVARAYDGLAARFAEEAERASARTVVIAGTVPEDHGEHVAANLAASLAAGGSRVALVALDSRSSVLRRLFALERGPGLAEVVRGDVALEEALARYPGLDNLALLTAGAPGAAGRPDGVVDALVETHDLVLVCAPLLFRWRRIRLPRADGVLLAINLHGVRRSRRPRVERLLRRADLRLLGYVLVGAQVSAALGRSLERPTPS